MRKYWRFILAALAVAFGIFASQDAQKPSAPPQLIITSNRLSQRIPEVNWEGENLRTVLVTFLHGIPYQVDDAFLAADGITLDRPIHARLRDVQMSKALEVALRQ